MNRFLDVVPLALTPLTPIHIGCGEDFEPTNYVIDGGSLYHFAPTRLALTEQEGKLLIQSANGRGDDAIRSVQRFFHERRSRCREASRLEMSVAGGVAEQYASRIGQVAQRERIGRAVTNQLQIERTAHHPHTGLPYLPGSGLKGAIRTAWLNHLDQGPPIVRDPRERPTERSTDVEADLLGGQFASDPFRLVDVADASGLEVRSHICFAVDRRKESRTDRDGRPIDKDLSVCCEVIRGGQFRAFRSEIRFDLLPASVKPENEKRIANFEALARACNKFYRERLSSELPVLKRLSGETWVAQFSGMIESLGPAFEEGRAMLLRVGRHSGAESVTLDRYRWIAIRGRRGQSRWAREPTTIWLAAESQNASAGMLPFGWLLVERSDTAAPEQFVRWCAAEKENTRSSSITRGRPSQRGAAAAAGQASGQYRFLRGDRVTNGEEQATVVRDVRSADARMDIRYDDGDVEEVPIARWTRAN
jgi:CRISPR-associated protein Csm5